MAIAAGAPFSRSPAPSIFIWSTTVVVPRFARKTRADGLIGQYAKVSKK